MLKRTTQLRADPAKTREWRQRSKPIKRKSTLQAAHRSQTAGTLIPSIGSRNGAQAATARKQQGISSKPRKRLQAKPDPKLAVWGREVRKRDGNKCRFPEGCASGDNRIDPHHIATRGRRPDLTYDARNGICLCRWHHDWVHDNPMQAERIGLLNFDSYELAQKLKAGYVVPGDENDHRVTL